MAGCATTYKDDKNSTFSTVLSSANTEVHPTMQGFILLALCKKIVQLVLNWEKCHLIKRL